jgi:glycosyltransferase involved in cell wall biosynthesis
MSRLALCIPAYNAAAYLPRLLSSARSQAIPFDEILVYDDCSTDNTAAVAESYGARVIHGDINRGCSYGKNELAKQSTCEWLHFHDADDDLYLNFSESVNTWINNNRSNYDILLLSFDYFDVSSGKLLATTVYNKDELHADALKYVINHKIVNFGVYKRSAFLAAAGFDLDPDVLYNEDNALHQRLAKYGLKFDAIQEVTCVNYRYDVSMSASNVLKCLRSNYYVLKKTAASHGSLYAAELTEKLWDCAARLTAEKDWEFVRKALKEIKQLGFKRPVKENPGFKLMAAINPFFALWAREMMIRTFKPYLRKAHGQ